ncbi:hypothetical protein VFPFJ_08912 [Purpureocillium lilacinum]|uniref:C6 zinc finger domain-containing protein n=1 Tax=Purpureocillium lilacinum TaxID=33203 RepID=A0A179GAZ4_PURLI|nr:hypothetical protein VFPFJ_08912 [Purpureocillium lilacinum]KAK4088276.1 hypothetical protein Purlil1_7469 [Purpureocillium lilacinum]OAQ74995.1 hypothetical protein VFPBJ_10289 [Purpureocillium lilacinum]OAQ83109.1 hypothetical protein VFPFJ_08912 [Purpureocillium lilacinum]PWI75464.1 hypothetical protein PCL_06122 [Purpureocillium lilacinum]GJN70592.1 hypothetical protein PLICBS_004650 [Purpureocillium lilacinum]
MAPGTEQQQQQQPPPPPEQHQTAAADAPLVMNESPVSGSSKQDRRMSDEWDASKVPPSRFQKRKGSIYATPNSRDGHIDRNYAEKYHAKIAEMKGGK